MQNLQLNLCLSTGKHAKKWGRKGLSRKNLDGIKPRMILGSVIVLEDHSSAGHFPPIALTVTQTCRSVCTMQATIPGSLAQVSVIKASYWEHSDQNILILVMWHFLTAGVNKAACQTHIIPGGCWFNIYTPSFWNCECFIHLVQLYLVSSSAYLYYIAWQNIFT